MLPTSDARTADWSASDPRTASSVTLGGMILCLLLSTVVSIAMPSRGAVSKNRIMPAMTAVGPAPAFCKNQTWPDVDARCLNRAEPAVAAAPVVANAPKVAAAPEAAATSVAAAPAPEAVSTPAVESSPAPTVTADISEPDLLPVEPQPVRPSHARSRRHYQPWNSPTGRSGW